MSGYELLDPNRKKLKTPLLSIYATNDVIVPAEFKPVNYEDLTEYAHDNEHKIPKGNPIARKVLSLLKTAKIYSMKNNKKKTILP